MRYDPSRIRIMNEDDYLETLDHMRTDVSTFTDNYYHAWNKAPDLDDFIETCPIYDHEIIYPEIRKEMLRIIQLITKENKGESISHHS